jgi:hypothetical protein
MSDGGKGSAPRPYSVDMKTFENNWDAIFGKNKTDNTGTSKNEYQDILSTEECLLRSNQETRDALRNSSK